MVLPMIFIAAVVIIARARSSRSRTLKVKRMHQGWADVSMRWCRMRMTSRLESDWR
jgi:hypothetical protein